jgi:sulfur dioxygenase
MLFRQLFDKDTSTYTYLLADRETHEAILIDPVAEQADRDLQLIEELGLKLKVVLDTHVHADHVTSGATLRERTGAKLGVSAAGHVASADLQLQDGDTVQVGKVVLEARATPGHTDGCMSFITADQTMVFTGDTLLIRGCGRTDFQQGDASTLYHSVHDKLFSLPDDCKVYPGHDYLGRTSSCIGEEKAYNPRLKLEHDEAAFVAIMDGLKLAKPARIDIAVPANLRSGADELEAPHAAKKAADPFDAVVRTATGVPEVPTGWLSAYGDQVKVVDVRQPEELSADGFVDGIDNVPLATLEKAAEGWNRAEPVLVLCRSGGRSGRAALILEKMGFHQVASMAGGMMQWTAEGRPVSRYARVA